MLRRFLDGAILLTLLVAIAPTFAYAADAPSAAELDAAYTGLRAWGGGAENKSITPVRAHVERATKIYEVRVDAERRLIEVIESKEAGKPAKIFAAEQLYRLCDDDTIPAFERMLARPDTWDLACTGLEIVKYPKAGRVLVTAAETAKGDKLVGIITSLGNRHDPAGVPPLRVLADEGDARTTEAALIALGKIPGNESMQALDWCRKNLSRKMRPSATQAYLQCGFTSLEKGDKATAIALFEALLLDFEPVEIQADGLRGLIKARGEDAVPTIIEALTSGIPELENVAAAEAHTVPGRKATEGFIAAYPDLTTENQAVLLRVAGIYGRGRNVLDWIRRGRITDVNRFVNLVHVEDLAGICLRALERARPGETYNVSDGRPRRWAEIYEVAAQRWSVYPPTPTARGEERGKHLSIAKLRAELDYTFQHPDLYEALDAIESSTRRAGN